MKGKLLWKGEGGEKKEGIFFFPEKRSIYKPWRGKFKDPFCSRLEKTFSQEGEGKKKGGKESLISRRCTRGGSFWEAPIYWGGKREKKKKKKKEEAARATGEGRRKEKEKGPFFFSIERKKKSNYFVQE